MLGMNIPHYDVFINIFSNKCTCFGNKNNNLLKNLNNIIHNIPAAHNFTLGFGSDVLLQF